MTTFLSVGGKKIVLAEAVKFAQEYLAGDGHWSYPAYDAYPGHAGPEVGRQDLLAVALLNAHQRPVESYYGLESLLPLINDRLADPALSGTLADADQGTVDAIARLFGILDEQRPKHVSLVESAPSEASRTVAALRQEHLAMLRRGPADTSGPQ